MQALEIWIIRFIVWQHEIIITELTEIKWPRAIYNLQQIRSMCYFTTHNMKKIEWNIRARRDVVFVVRVWIIFTEYYDLHKVSILPRWYNENTSWENWQRNWQFRVPRSLKSLTSIDPQEYVRTQFQRPNYIQLFIRYIINIFETYKG